jgi:hypothetical protein
LTGVVLGLRGASCFLRPPEKVDMKDDICCVTFGAVVEAVRGRWGRRSWGRRRGGVLLNEGDRK